jgi:hypothetical protein
MIFKVGLIGRNFEELPFTVNATHCLEIPQLKEFLPELLESPETAKIGAGT